MAVGDNPEATLAANQALTEVLAEHVNLYARRRAALEQEVAMLRNAKGIADSAKIIIQKNLDLKRNAIAAAQQELEKLQEQRAEHERLVLSGRNDEQTKQRILELQGKIGNLTQQEVQAKFEALSVAKQLL